MAMDLIQMVEGLNITKTNLLQARKNSASWQLFELELQPFPGSSTHQPTLQILDLLSLLKCVNWFIKRHLFLFIYIYPVGSVSLKNPD